MHPVEIAYIDAYVNRHSIAIALNDYSGTDKPGGLSIMRTLRHK